MIKPLFVTLLSATLATAAIAAPPPPTPPSPPPPIRADVCRPGGDVLFEIDNKILPAFADQDGFPTSEARLYSSGAWTIVEHSKGKLTRRASGCMEQAQVRAIRRALTSAPWTTTHAEFACAAVSATFTEYRSHGEMLFADVLCGNDNLDDMSRKRLSEAAAILDAATRRPAIETGGHKP